MLLSVVLVKKVKYVNEIVQSYKHVNKKKTGLNN